MKKLIVILFLLGHSLIQAQVSKLERKILSSIDGNKQESLKLLEEVVNINSGSMNFDGVNKVGQIFKTRTIGMCPLAALPPSSAERRRRIVEGASAITQLLMLRR